MEESQQKVAAFVKAHGLHAKPEWRALDLQANAGALAKALLSKTNFGKNPVLQGDSALAEAVGYAAYSLLALADELGVDATAALKIALEKKAAFHAGAA